MGGQSLGCHADGIHPECRFCDKAPFQSVPCPASARPAYGFKECWFPHGSNTAHYWDEACEWGILGCWANGVNAQCRFCGSGVYDSIPCPSSALDNNTTTIDVQDVQPTSTSAPPREPTSTIGGIVLDTTTSEPPSSTSYDIAETSVPQVRPTTTGVLTQSTSGSQELPTT